MTVFDTIFLTDKLNNHTLYQLAKAEYIKRGYSAKKARYAALGMMSARTQSGYCWYLIQNNTVTFYRESVKFSL